MYEIAVYILLTIAAVAAGVFFSGILRGFIDQFRK